MEIKDELIKLCKENEVEKMVLFGSRARGDNKKNSDIDLAIWTRQIHEARFFQTKYATKSLIRN